MVPGETGAESRGKPDDDFESYFPLTQPEFLSPENDHSLNLGLCVLSCLSHVQLFATPWTVACKAPLSMGFPNQEYWSRLPCFLTLQTHPRLSACHRQQGTLAAKGQCCSREIVEMGDFINRLFLRGKGCKQAAAQMNSLDMTQGPRLSTPGLILITA